MRIVEKRGTLTVQYSRIKNPDLTWRKVREWCYSQLEKIDSSKEASEIVSIKEVVNLLTKKIDNFEARRSKYVRMINTIKDSDPDIDRPFNRGGESNE